MQQHIPCSARRGDTSRCLEAAESIAGSMNSPGVKPEQQTGGDYEAE